MFEDSISSLYMVGPTYAKRLEKLDIKTIEDLLYHLPFRYDDFSIISKISDIQPGETVTIKASVLEIKNQFTKYGKKITRATVADETGQTQIIWFNMPFITNVIKKQNRVYFSGKVDRQGLVSPEYELVKETPPIHTACLVPIYPETYGVSSKWLRSRIYPLLKPVPDFLPEEIKTEENLYDLTTALKQAHFPNNLESSQKAISRLSFDELFLIQLSSRLRKLAWATEKVGQTLIIDQEKILNFINSLPFTLTNAQNKAVKEILNDLQKETPSNRLLEGDVGSGKTVVAAIAIYATFLNGLKSAFMAPTEILVSQHLATLKTLLDPFNIKVGLQTTSVKDKDFDVLVGTHALLSEKLKINNLGLVVIDEQHRFGVEQRAILKNKGVNPHLLSMTATPIPRTMALTLYGELDLSILDEMPTGRIPVKTWVVPNEKRENAYKWIEEQVKDTPNQAFIICPFIESSESLTTVKAAKEEFEKLKNDVFPNLRLGLLHGKLKSKEKNEILNNFKNGELDILVSTPVVEVGIDIPTATIMMIEGAERFGLAQLHQLRGRVGRGKTQSYCLLFSDSENATLRLKILERENIGSKIAEFDLKNRGAGEIFGTAQHGKLSLKIASLTDESLIKKSGAWATQISEIDPTLQQYPLLKQKISAIQSQQIIEPN